MNLLRITFSTLIICTALMCTTFSALNHASEPNHPTKQFIKAPVVDQFSNTNNKSTSKPYGYNLFSQSAVSSESENSNYRISVGDRIDLKLWGAYKANQSMTVGADGKIFVPNVGPVNVQGIQASQLNSHIAKKISTVYSNNVKSYARVASSTPINVFISGGVNKPGQYAASARDSIISLLSLANGINPTTGSYRRIRILRNNASIRQVDLYDFLKNGRLKHFNFRNNDVIHVEKKGTSISLSGSTPHPLSFEFKAPRISGRTLIQYAAPYPNTSHVAVSGIRNGQTFYKYINLQEFKNLYLYDQDKVSFEADHHVKTLGIQVQGSFEGPSFIAVNNGTRLHHVLNQIPINQNLSDLGSIYLKRKSVAAQQKRNLQQSLFNLEKSIQTAPSRSDGEASIRAREAALIKDFVAKAETIQPEGRVIISEKRAIQNILLENDDIIVIPNRTDIILVSGEVFTPRSLVYRRGISARSYIERSGGFTDRANKKKIAIIKRNGEVLLSKNTQLEAGDNIVVLPKVDTKFVQSTKDITQIIYQIALAAAVGIRNL